MSVGLVWPAVFAIAQAPTDNYVANLRALGYDKVEISRTFLGRYRIIAHRDGAVREIVMARNGIILFDYLDVTTTLPTPVSPLGNDALPQKNQDSPKGDQD